eukprot:12428860-Alexandrium_andersonii.AAC.1
MWTRATAHEPRCIALLAWQCPAVRFCLPGFVGCVLACRVLFAHAVDSACACLGTLENFATPHASLQFVDALFTSPGGFVHGFIAGGC